MCMCGLGEINHGVKLGVGKRLSKINNGDFD